MEFSIEAPRRRSTSVICLILWWQQIFSKLHTFTYEWIYKMDIRVLTTSKLTFGENFSAICTPRCSSRRIFGNRSCRKKIRKRGSSMMRQLRHSPKISTEFPQLTNGWVEIRDTFREKPQTRGTTLLDNRSCADRSRLSRTYCRDTVYAVNIINGFQYTYLD